MTNSSNDIFLGQLDQIHTALLKQAKSNVVIHLIKISKNDSIKRRVSQITERLHNGEIIIIASYSNGIPKQISILEIAKQQSKQSGKLIKQFNKLTKIESSTNPNEKKKDSKQAGETNEEQEQEEAYKECLASVRLSTIFTLPVMYTILSTSEMIDQLDLSEWTTQ